MWLMIERALRLLDEALDRDVLLVKGAGLALATYASPTARPMSDVDVVAPRAALPGLARRLRDAGFREHASERPLTEADLELQLVAPMMAAPVLVELHAGLDKVVQRPIGYAEILARSTVAPGFRHLRIPAPADHVVLVALHLALSDFLHRPGFADLAALLADDADLNLAMDRAERWGVWTALATSLELLARLDAEAVPASALARCRARRLRRPLILRIFHLPGEAAAHSGSLGLPWILRQTLLRDDLAHWALGLGVYGAKRVAERALTRWRRSPSSG